ncbi:hypothetical protein C8T65DRAFT_58508 [Cerioporus squamosus]|nr:hypothetical protein C8T65DRAFT_58508 [Cerioporus squamosus]
MDGPWLRLYACVQADRWICQPLLPAIYTAIPSRLPSKHILSVCKVFQAFRDAIDDIDCRTKETVAKCKTTRPESLFGEDIPQPSIPPKLSRPTIMTPAPTNCGNLTLEYLHVVDQHNLTYIAELSSGWQDLGMTWPRVVVKFAESYGADAHRLLEKAGYAPKLIYCGKPYAATFPRFSDVDMVVIEALPDEGLVERGSAAEPPRAEVCRKVRNAVRLLHQHHYVHGNITWQTVYSNEAGNGVDVRLLNFDYAGKEGEVRYSVYLPQTPEHVGLPAGVAPLKLVTKEQDEYFLDAMFPNN